MTKKDKKTEPGRYAYEGLDRILHEKARLGILSSLASRPDGLLFSELKEMCSLTDGNLSKHLQTLEEAGLVKIYKGFQNKRPQTLSRLSNKGRERFIEYLSELEKVVKDAAAVKKETKAGKKNPLKGWLPV